MLPLLKKEFNSFFTNPTACIVIGVFLLINGLFLWFFKDEFNILIAGFADLIPFFYLSPWMFMFLIPAITMKSFADEFSVGTIELLKTNPISDWQIVFSKFFASLLLFVSALVPTLFYVITIYNLANPIGNIDFGSIIGSYLGLFFLATSYISIGLFTSTLSKNQIVAFISAVFIIFLLYYGFEAISNSFNNNLNIKKIGINEHYKSISRGVIDTRDITYFLSLSAFFLIITKIRLSNDKNLKKTLIFCVFFIVMNIVNQYFYNRFDLTLDKRYTLSKTTKNIISNIKKPLIITVFLEGNISPEINKLQSETRQYLEELSDRNSKIKIKFASSNKIQERLIERGMTPSKITIEEDGKLSEIIFFPWVEVYYNSKSTNFSLLPNTVFLTQKDQLQKAFENLEFNFTNAINLVVQKSQKKIAVITGNGQLQDVYLYSFLSEISKKYKLAKFTLDSVATNPKQTLKELSRFDLAIIAKPTEKFTESEKFTLDQFIANGGRSLWMIDNVNADQDSLFNTGKTLAYPRDLNLTDLLFSYGVRVNYTIIKDLYASKISLATGKVGNQTQFQNLKWFYHPLANGNTNHPITKNIAPVRLKFANQIDTLKNNINKTPLLVSSKLTQKFGTPNFISLQSIRNNASENNYKSGVQIYAVLLEGNFNSAYKNRLKPFETGLLKESSINNKMVVVADGDIGKNQILNGEPYDLSTDKWTNEKFGNKDFLLNAIDYLLDDIGLITLRNKSLNIRFLDKQKAIKEMTFWQIINVALPITILLLFVVVFNLLRKFLMISD